MGKPDVALIFTQQCMAKELLVSVDSDLAADRRSRKFTIGMVQRLGARVVKARSSLQSSIGFSVSEAEYYDLVDGATHGFGLRAYFIDLGIDLLLAVESNYTSAKSFASRRGLGKPTPRRNSTLVGPIQSCKTPSHNL